MEIAELPYGTGKGQHPFFVGAQFHPEFLARPLKPHALFTAFMNASKDRKKKMTGKRVVPIDAAILSAETETV
jgi:CTP synthase (UTP-ammonia lyase)